MGLTGTLSHSTPALSCFPGSWEGCSETSGIRDAFLGEVGFKGELGGKGVVSSLTLGLSLSFRMEEALDSA